ncbi:MAG: ABC transporter permease [Firmicutes bacterium ZCTH02-B6]|nr:MAG: ABC transporter permease [Firmicutes bacterium ZCTH02-B6]
MVEVLEAIANGVLVGGVYAIISVGLTLVYGIMDIVNFAQADFLMLGMFAAYLCAQFLGLDPVLSSILVFPVIFLVGALVQRGLVQRVQKAPIVSQIFLTVGLSLVLQSLMQMIFGANFRSVTTSYQTKAISVGPLNLSVPYVLAFLASAVMALALWLFLERTDLGRCMRATAQNRVAATLVGIDPSKMYLVAFGIGTALAGMAGAVILPYAYVFPTVGHQYALIMFTVVVLGGLGNVLGSLVGGLLVGVIHSVSAVFLPTQLQNLVVFIIFILTLTFKPTGLVGRRAA